MPPVVDVSRGSVRRGSTRFQSLARLGRLVSASLDIDTILGKIVDAARELMGVTVASFWLADEAEHVLELRASSDPAHLREVAVRRLRFGESGAGWVAEHGEPLVVDDVVADGRFFNVDWMQQRGITSFCGVPVPTDGAPAGVLALMGSTPFRLSHEDKEILSSLVAQAMSAIRNARLYAASEQRRCAAEALAEVGRALSSARGPDEVCRLAVESVNTLLGSRSSAIYTVDGDTCVCQVAADPVGFGWSPRLRVGEGIVGTSIALRGPVSTADSIADTRITYPAEMRARVAARGHRALLTVPLMAHDRLIGALATADRTGRVYGAAELRLAQSFADQVAVALENARLFAEATQRRLEAELISDVARDVGQVLDSETAARRIADVVRTLLGAKAAAVYRADPKALTLSNLAVVGDGFDAVLQVPRGAGVSGLAVLERRPIATANILTDQRISLPAAVRTAMERSRLLACLGVPLLVQDGVVGALLVVDEEGRRFGDDAIRVAQTFAGHAALALDNARLFEAAEQRSRESSELAAAAFELTESLDVTSVAQRIVERVQTLFHARAARLRMLDDGGALRLLASTGRPPASGVGDDPPPAGLFAGRALLEGRPVWTPDELAERTTDRDGSTAQDLRRRDDRAILAVPLRLKGRIVGTVSVGDVTGRAFAPAEIGLLQAFADQAALALENAGLHDEAEHRRRQAEVFTEIAGHISASLDLETTLKHVTEAARELTGADIAEIALREPGSDVAVSRYWIGVDDEPERMRSIAPGNGAGGLVLATGQPFRSDDYASDARITQDDASVARHDGIRALLAVPVRSEERVEGVLYVACRAPRPFSDGDEAVLTRLADHAAIAIRNGRLVASLRDYQARLESLFDVSTQLARIQSTQSLLAAIAKASAQVFADSAVAFRLVEGDELVLAGAWGDLAAADLMPRIKIGEGRTGLAAQTGTPQLIADVTEDASVLQRDVFLRLGYRSALAMPVKSGERVAGVLSVLRRPVAAFSQQDVDLAAALAAQLATALENSRLFQEVQRAYVDVSQTQEQLVQSQKMDAVGRLAGGIAHDFNNLLTIILGRTAILGRRLTGDDKAGHDITLIEETARRAAALTSQLLAFSRKQVLQPRVLDLNQVVESVGGMLRRLIGEPITLVLRQEPALGRIKADRNQLDQVILNLAVNARDAMPDGGTLTIETANVDLDETFARQHEGARPGRYVCLSVRDTGYGMDPGTVAHVFEPFFTTKGLDGGTGLGLSMVYGIVKQHDGYISVSSEPGNGTAFAVYLPRSAEAALREEGETTDRGREGSETILLVEDEDDVRDLTREILEMSGYRVLEAASPNEALRIARHHRAPIHLMLTDVVMPGASGPQLSQELRRVWPDLGVVYMSGYPDEALGRHGVLEPDTILVSKPFTPAQLISTLHHALDERRAAGATG